MIEIKKIEGTKYSISSDGILIGPKSVVKPNIKSTGYCEVCIYSGKTRKYWRLHRLVATIFIPNPENKPFVNHIDGNKLNNAVNNLEWVTHQENMNHAKETGLVLSLENNPRATFNNEQIHEVCRLLEQGYRNCDLADIFGVEKHIISSIRYGLTFSGISKNYKIPKRSLTHSAETIEWLCERIEEGLTQGEILKLTTNPKINKWLIQDLRQKRAYTDICNKYNF